MSTDLAQRDVMEFHLAMGAGVGESPAICNAELRAALIYEEAGETCSAIEAGDLVGAIDGLCDLIYVALGTAVEFGIDLAPFWAEVHRSNMAKVGGPVREDGKRMKPPGWTGPDLARVLAEQAGGPSGVGVDSAPEHKSARRCVNTPGHGNEGVSFDATAA